MLKIDLVNNISVLKRLALLQFVLFLSLISFKLIANIIYIYEEGFVRNIIVVSWFNYISVYPRINTRYLL